jgi:hypothetical protein
MRKTLRQNISDVLTNQGRHDIIRRFKEDESPPILTFLQDGEKVSYKVVSIKKGIWVVPVTLYKPDDLKVVDAPDEGADA